MIVKTKILKKHGMSVKEIAGILGVREKLVRRDDVGYCSHCDTYFSWRTCFPKTERGYHRRKCDFCLRKIRQAKLEQLRRLEWERRQKKWYNKEYGKEPDED